MDSQKKFEFTFQHVEIAVSSDNAIFNVALPKGDKLTFVLRLNRDGSIVGGSVFDAVSAFQLREY